MTAIHTLRSFAELRAHFPVMEDGDVAPIPGVPGEAYLMENGQPRRIKASVLPAGYYEAIAAQQEANTAAMKAMPVQGSQPMLVNATAAKALEQGFDSEADLGIAEMRARQSEAAAASIAARRAKAETDRSLAARRRVFHPSQMFDDPAELVDINALRTSFQTTMRALVSTADYDPACEIITLKMWDGLAYLAERGRHNVQEQADVVKRRIAQLSREGDGLEINVVQIEREEQRLQGLRVQWFHFNEMLKVAKAEAKTAVGISGIDWPAYQSLEDRAKRGAQAHRQAQRAKKGTSHAVIGMTDREYQNWLKDQSSYRPKRDGIDARESHTQPSTDPS